MIENLMGLKTPPELLELLAESAKHAPTPEEIAEQRKAWVIGEMGIGSDQDEQDFAAADLAGDVNLLKLLNAKAEARAEAARQWLESRGAPPIDQSIIDRALVAVYGDEKHE